MEKLSINDVIEKIKELDNAFKGSGWKRENTLEINYEHPEYNASLSVYTKDEDEDND